MQDNKTEGLKIQRTLFLIVFGVLFLLVLLLVRPFLTILLWSSLFYGLTYPLYRSITTDKAGAPRHSMARTTFAILFSLGSIVLLVLPLILLAGVLVNQLMELFTLSLLMLKSGSHVFESQGYIDVAARLSTVASLIPLVGAGLVWVLVVLMRLATGSLGSAILLFILSAVFISSLDNFIRPLLLHARMKLHPLLIFISIISGLQLFGFNGLLLGPIILVLFFSAVDMFGQAYGKPEVEHESTETPRA